MGMYLVLVLMVLPAAPGGADAPAPAVELHRIYMTASSPLVCQTHADKLAAQQRQAHAGTVQRLNASVVGTCTPLQAKP